MRSVKAIREQIVELRANMSALIKMAEDDTRDFTPEEQVAFDAWLSILGEDGETKTGLFAEQAKSDKFDTVKASLAIDTPGHQIPNTPNRITPRATGYKTRAFRGENAQEDCYKSGMWLKAVVFKDEAARAWCNDNGVPVVRGAQTGSTDTQGGFLVPTPLAQAIIDVRDEFGVARDLCERVPMTSDALNYPKRTSGVTVYYPAQAAAITASDIVFANVALAVVKRATLTKVANELINDSPFNVADFVAMDAGQAIASAGDDEWINGDGTSTWGGEEGLLDQIHADQKTNLTSTNTAFTDIVLADFNTLMGDLGNKYFQHAPSWLMRRGTYSTVCQKLMYAAGGDTTESLAGMPGPTFMGYPVNFSDHMPVSAVSTCACLFGSFSASTVIGDRDDIGVAASEEYAFDEDVTTVRAISRYDIAVHDVASGGAIVGIYTAAS